MNQYAILVAFSFLYFSQPIRLLADQIIFVKLSNYPIYDYRMIIYLTTKSADENVNKSKQLKSSSILSYLDYKSILYLVLNHFSPSALN